MMITGKNYIGNDLTATGDSTYATFNPKENTQTDWKLFEATEDEINKAAQKAKDAFDGIIINAAGYTHTSVAILDALLAINLPTIEVHITNIYNREEFRKKSLISKAAKGIICGFGVNGYIMALDSMKEIFNK